MKIGIRTGLIIALFATIIGLQSCEDGTSTPNYIVGRTTRSAWEANVGFNGYTEYTPAAAAVQAIRDTMTRHTGIRFSVFASPWCGTCVHSTPQVFKTLDAIGYPDSLLLFVALDSDKSDPEGLARKDNVATVFALIIKNNDIEIGRITGAYQPWEIAIATILEKVK